jgi:hypothetical protein
MTSIRWIVCAGLLVGAASPSGAQRLRGTVVDSSNGQPVAGVVIMLLDSANAPIARNLSDQQGAFVFPEFPGVRKVRALRIGFRPREFPFPASDTGEASIAIVMAPLPRMLDPVHSVVAARCKGGKRVVEAYGLLEQARDALLATIVAAETRPASMVLIGYRRSYNSSYEDDRHLSDQIVHIDTIAARPRTYVAVKTPAEFMSAGFSGEAVLGSRGGLSVELLAPDAETLISPEFADNYCFDIGDDDKRRPGQVALTFRRPDESNRTDLEGTIWIDTTARVLREVEYEYVRESQPKPRSSGNIRFRAFPNGSVLIDSWQIAEIRRMRATTITTVRSPVSRSGMPTGSATSVTLSTSGGMLAQARWPDGTSHDAPLGSATIEVKREDGRAPAAGMWVQLVGSPYSARTDSLGIAQFTGILPVSYAVMAFDSLVAPYRIGMYPSATIRVDANATASRSVKAITAVDYITQRCKRAKRVTGDNYLLGRVVDSRGAPLKDAEVVVSRFTPGGNWEPIGAPQKTAADGYWFLCEAGIIPGSEIRATATRFGQTVSAETRANAKVTILDVRVP